MSDDVEVCSCEQKAQKEECKKAGWILRYKERRIDESFARDYDHKIAGFLKYEKEER